MLQRSTSKHNMQPHGDVCGGTTYFTNKQMSDYLKDLRTKRTQRPSGARPMGARPVAVSQPRDSMSQSRSTSAFSSQPVHEPSNTGDRMHFPEYVERDQRQHERTQARAMRLAMEELDFEDEQRITDAAKRESTDLIRRHQYPDAPYRVSDDDAATTQRSTSGEVNTMPAADEKEIVPQPRSIQTAEQKQDESSTLISLNRKSSKKRTSFGTARPLPFPNATEKIYEDPPAAVRPRMSLIAPRTGVATRRNPFARARNSLQNTSGGTVVGPLPVKHSGALHRKFDQQSQEPQYTAKEILKSTVVSVERDIDAEPEPVRYKDGKEVRSEEIRAATSRKLRERSPQLPSPTAVSDSPGRPIVSFKKDWSPSKETLQQADQTPVADVNPARRLSNNARLSDSAANRKSVELPSIQIISDDAKRRSAPLPSIQIDEDVVDQRASNRASQPAIAVQPPAVPSIKVAEPPSQEHGNPAEESAPRPRHKPQATRDHRPRDERRISTLCAQCALPIKGRTVSAAGIRFHPECFRCYYCGEGLECVGFYPEPARHRDERQDRIDRRLAGEDVYPPDGISLEEDEDDSLRFYCHLDFHELFSPRCKSCKTPIEGEVIVACGAEWHVGHFFCAQCGDPFDPATPFVEKDGYAWCVNCHLNRFSGKCTGCRKPITEKVVQALGVDWHPACFRCSECSRAIDGGQYFLRGDKKEVVCQDCEQRRLKE